MYRLRDFLEDMRWRAQDMLSSPRALAGAAAALVVVALAGLFLFANPFAGGGDGTAENEPAGPPLQVQAEGECKDVLEDLHDFIGKHEASALPKDKAVAEEFGKLMEVQRQQCPVKEQDAYYNTELSAWLLEGVNQQEPPAAPGGQVPGNPPTSVPAPAEPAAK